MEEIIKSLDALAENEFLEKLKERGKFVDSHQAYGVIKEEIEEAEDELEYINGELDYLWAAVKHDDTEQVVAHAKHIEDSALLLAAEAIQVAAMGKKAKFTL